jgi:hypothetical protein
MLSRAASPEAQPDQLPQKIMYTQESLSIQGHEDRPVPNRFLRRSAACDHLAVLLPGFAYGADLPVLFYPGRLLLERGADLLKVEYAYHADPAFDSASAAERAARLTGDVTAALSVGLQQRDYRRITLIGKSLGTLAMAALLASDERVRGADCIWLTPLVKDDRLRAVVAARRPRSLFVAGSADHHYDRALLDEVIASTGGGRLVIEGADHSLEIAGDVLSSVEAMARVVRAIRDFSGG